MLIPIDINEFIFNIDEIVRYQTARKHDLDKYSDWDKFVLFVNMDSISDNVDYIIERCRNFTFLQTKLNFKLKEYRVYSSEHVIVQIDYINEKYTLHTISEFSSFTNGLTCYNLEDMKSFYTYEEYDAGIEQIEKIMAEEFAKQQVWKNTVSSIFDSYVPDCGCLVSEYSISFEN
jgi:hypothetical protein